MKEITSPQNPFVKELLVAQDKPRERKKLGWVIVEGLREITLAVKSGLRMKYLLFNPSVTQMDVLDFGGQEAELIQVSASIMEKISYRSNVPNAVAIFGHRELLLTDFEFKKESPLVLVLETVEKPGNLGAMLRTADAAGVDLVLVCDPTTDIYNPNAIRNSLGGIFTLPVIACESEEAINFLRKNNIAIYATYLKASIPYTEADMTKGLALVVGSEAQGISDIWVNESDQNIIIPMQGQVDSLNVSNAAAIVLFEALRQRC